ncbi:MAG: hypothetical protein VX639_08045, partial [Pseudomonadota bacterium]|nr:hypothetical protein [Pseudomonadota bacterium]
PFKSNARSQQIWIVLECLNFLKQLVFEEFAICMAQKRCTLEGVANNRELPSDVCGSNNQILLLGGGCQHGRHTAQRRNLSKMCGNV